MKQYQTRNKIHEQKRSEERIQKIVRIFFHLAFCLCELQSISMCIFSCSWFSTAATALEIRTVFSAIAVFQSTTIQFNGVYSKDTFENLSKSVKDSQCCLAVIFSSSSVSFILTMKYAIYLHVCVAHRFYLIELRLHKYVRTHDACTIHENLILASRRGKKTHMRHESVVICIPIGEKWSSKCSNILTPNMQNEKKRKTPGHCHTSSVYSNECAYIILLWSSRHYLYTYFPFEKEENWKTKRTYNTSKNVVPIAVVQCNFTKNMENSKFTCVKDNHASLMYVHCTQLKRWRSRFFFEWQCCSFFVRVFSCLQTIKSNQTKQ